MTRRTQRLAPFFGPVAAAILASSPAAAADLGTGPGSLKDPPAYREDTGYSPLRNYYVELRGGLAFPDDTDFNANAATNIVNTYEDAGYFIGGAFGFNLLETAAYRLRGDVELGYRDADVESHIVNGTSAGSAASFGSTSIFYGLANLSVDLKTGTALTPYLSAGGGFGNVEFDGHGANGATLMDDSATGYAFQAGAGINYEFGGGLSFNIGYRYLAIYDLELTSVGGTTSSTDVTDHQMLFGLRQSF